MAQRGRDWFTVSDLGANLLSSSGIRAIQCRVNVLKLIIKAKQTKIVNNNTKATHSSSLYVSTDL